MNKIQIISKWAETLGNRKRMCIIKDYIIMPPKRTVWNIFRMILLCWHQNISQKLKRMFLTGIFLDQILYSEMTRVRLAHLFNTTIISSWGFSFAMSISERTIRRCSALKQEVKGSRRGHHDLVVILITLKSPKTKGSLTS